jgi:hypothetical protein
MTNRSGSEKRRKDVLVGVRVDAELGLLLRDRAARSGITPAEFTRQLLQADLAGAQPVAHIARSRLVVSEEDRTTIGTFSRSAGLLAGALVLAAKATRLAGFIELHSDIERLLVEVKEAQAVALRVLEAML